MAETMELQPSYQSSQTVLSSICGCNPCGKRAIYVNAFCDVQFKSHWRERLVVVDDGATCYWQAVYDPVAKKFSQLKVNSRG